MNIALNSILINQLRNLIIIIRLKMIFAPSINGNKKKHEKNQKTKPGKQSYYL